MTDHKSRVAPNRVEALLRNAAFWPIASSIPIVLFMFICFASGQLIKPSTTSNVGVVRDWLGSGGGEHVASPILAGTVVVRGNTLLVSPSYSKQSVRAVISGRVE